MTDAATAASGGFDAVFNVIHGLTNMVRGLINSITPEYANFVLLGLSIVGGYYIVKKYPNISGYWLISLYAAIIFLLLKFV